ncbi:MAG TPA: hypothetical protein DDY65_08450 [Ruminococcaceae bacterium]|nr:hypothetical protein [Oscillospiraceae bacterium]
MAVAFSTGGSGYMRSDFMISDAAIPQRMEELSADQSDKFSQVLSGFSGKNEAPVDASKTVERFTGSDGKVDMHALAKAVADGEVKLEDIPPELLTQELFTELTKLVEVPENEDGEPTREAAQEAMSELAALFTAQQTVQPEQVSDKSGEMTELSQPTVEAVQAPVVTQAQPEQPQTVQAQPGQAAQPQESQDAGEIQTVQSFQTAQPEQPIREQTAPAAQEPQPTEMTTAQPQEQPAVPTQETPQQDSNGTELSGQTAAVQQPVSGEPQRSDVTEFTVRTAEPQAKQPEESKQEAPLFTEHSTQRSRVVSKSDELEMIRGTADGTKSDAVQVQPQTTQSEAPVVFTRADGTELEVRPAEVVKQVADRLIEKASDLKEGETEYTVTLEPQDLGKITVRMVKTADGAVSVSIAAENSRTLRIIEENGAHIQDSLKQNGVQLENWQTVSESQQEMHAEDYRGSSRNPYRESEGGKQEDDSGDKSFAELIASM